MLQTITHFGKQIEIDIPEGHELVDAWRDGTKFWSGYRWIPIEQSPTLAPGIYIAPIRLRIGENYRCRNGQETGPLLENASIIRHGWQIDNQHKPQKIRPFYSSVLGQTYAANGLNTEEDKLISQWDIIAHIPKKEEKKMVPIKLDGALNFKTDGNYTEINIPISEAARIAQLPEVQAEVERQRKEREIGTGDWFRQNNTVHQCRGFDQNKIVTMAGHRCTPSDCTKIKDPVFIAFLEEGVKP